MDSSEALQKLQLYVEQYGDWVWKLTPAKAREKQHEYTASAKAATSVHAQLDYLAKAVHFCAIVECLETVGVIPMEKYRSRKPVEFEPEAEIAEEFEEIVFSKSEIEAFGFEFEPQFKIGEEVRVEGTVSKFADGTVPETKVAGYLNAIIVGVQIDYNGISYLLGLPDNSGNWRVDGYLVDEELVSRPVVATRPVLSIVR